MNWMMIVGAVVGFILGIFITRNWLKALIFALIGFLIAIGVITVGFQPGNLAGAFG